MSQCIEIHVDGKDVVIPYTPAALIAAPVEVARLAVAKAEVAYMQEYVRHVAAESGGRAFQTKYGPFETLEEFIESGAHQIVTTCVFCFGGRAGWEMLLQCDECYGSGCCETTKGKTVPCPVCHHNGEVAKFSFETDIDGQFVGYGETPVKMLTREMTLQFETVPFLRGAE